MTRFWYLFLFAAAFALLLSGNSPGENVTREKIRNEDSTIQSPSISATKRNLPLEGIESVSQVIARWFSQRTDFKKSLAFLSWCLSPNSDRDKQKTLLHGHSGYHTLTSAGFIYLKYLRLLV